MNKIETFVYNIVRKNPALKQGVRNFYQGVFDLLPVKSNYYKNPPAILEGFFFGFHDVSPWNKSEDKLLAMHPGFDLRMPQQNEKLEIGYFDVQDGKVGKFNKIGFTTSWNWHKGCRLQWVDNERAIYNTFENGILGARIIHTETKESVFIPFPIDAVHEDKATSFSYERLERCMPGYGYPYSDNGMIEEASPKSTGLFLVDLNTGKRELLLNLEQIATKAVGRIETEYLHFVTHTEFSPDGRYISFLYRRIPKIGDYMKRRSMVGVYDRKTGDFWFLNTQESGSHYVWNGKDQIILSGNYNQCNCHMLIDVVSQGAPTLIDAQHLNSDGHQSFIDDTTFITDTYPDKRRMAKIYRVNILNNSSEKIADIYSPKPFQTKDFKCHIACDLHPRVSPSGKFVSFDMVSNSKRSLAIMRL